MSIRKKLYTRISLPLLTFTNILEYEQSSKRLLDTHRNFLLIDLLSRYSESFGSSRWKVDAKFNLTYPSADRSHPVPSHHRLFLFIVWNRQTFVTASLTVSGSNESVLFTEVFRLPSLPVWQTLDELLSTGSFCILIHPFPPFHNRSTWRRQRI